jgi:hypothetical protein
MALSVLFESDCNVPLLASLILTALYIFAVTCFKLPFVDLGLQSSVCKHLPLLTSQILIVFSRKPDAGRAESCEKAIKLI